MEAAEGFEEFVRTVELGSVTAAARALKLPRATVSRRLAVLEENLGVSLLHRTTRSMTLTEPGEELYPRARRVVQIAREAEEAIRRFDGVPRGCLRIAVPMGVPREAFGPIVVEFLELFPEVEMELVASSEHVDLVAEGFDLALRAGPVEDTSLIAKHLVHNRIIIVASPQYLEARGTPCSPEALRDHNCIVGYRSGIAPETEWPLYSGGTVAVRGSFTTNHMALRVEAAKRHLGIAIAVDELAAPELTQGTLVEVLPGVVGREERVALVYPERRFIAPKVRAFVDFFSRRINDLRSPRK